jgi:hypothetical protein
LEVCKQSKHPHKEHGGSRGSKGTQESNKSKSKLFYLQRETKNHTKKVLFHLSSHLGPGNNRSQTQVSILGAIEADIDSQIACV